MNNFESRVVLYVVSLLGVIGWVAAGFQSCRVERAEGKLLEAVAPALQKEGYVPFDVNKIRDETLPPGVRPVAVAEGTVRYGPEGSRAPGADIVQPTPVPPPRRDRTEPSPPPVSAASGSGGEACDLDSLSLDLRCRLEVVGMTVGDREWFGRLLVSGSIRAPNGHERTLSEHVARDVRLVVDPRARERTRKWWAALRAGASTAPGLIVGGSAGRGRYGAWAHYEWRESGNAASGGLEVRW